MNGREEADKDREDEDRGAEAAAETEDTEVDMGWDDCTLCWWRAGWDRRSDRDDDCVSESMGAEEDGTLWSGGGGGKESVGGEGLCRTECVRLC